MSEANGLIVVQRKDTYVCSARTWKIMIDGKEEGRIRNGQSISLMVPAGEHLVHVDPGPDMINSKRLEVRIKAGQEIEMTCGPTSANLGAKLQVGDAITRTVVETDRYEVPMGDEIRTIDNLQGFSPIVRTFHLSREWTKSYTVGSEQSITVTQSSAFVSKLAELGMQAGRTISQHYSATGQERRTFEHTLTITAAPRTHSEITFA